MQNLDTYNQDGASYQARAVLAYLSRFTIEASWNEKYNMYDATVKVARWENCREQGYILSLRSKDSKRQINIAFFEHRNSDRICAIEWEQRSINSLTIETSDFSSIYKDKYDASHSVGYGMANEMSEWIEQRLDVFWLESGAQS